jgi:hypothetical protein
MPTSLIHVHASQRNKEGAFRTLQITFSQRKRLAIFLDWDFYSSGSDFNFLYLCGTVPKILRPD